MLVNVKIHIMNVLRMPGRCSMVFDDAAPTSTTVNFKRYKIPVRMAGREVLDKLFFFFHDALKEQFGQIV